MADFETTTNANDCRVWSWFHKSVDDLSEPVSWGKDISSFVDFIASENTIVYFHNLKFDGTFLLDFMLRDGYKHVEGYPQKMGEFSTLIDRMGKFYSIRVWWWNGGKTEFRDSMKKLAFKVAEIAKAFDLHIRKGEIDYEMPRPIGYEPTQDELDYGFNDVEIIAYALSALFDSGATKLTAGADSLHEFKETSGKRFFDKVFPILDPEIDTDIRTAYRGGFTYANPKFKQRMLGHGKVYDVNSLYPSVMREHLLPYGEPEYFSGVYEHDRVYPLWIQSLTFTARLRKNHIPTVQVKKTSYFIESEYQEIIGEPITMSFTNVDLEILFKHYHVDIVSYNGGWKFKGLTGLFNKFIDKWMEVKINSTGAMKQIAKLHLNSLYGKFATNPTLHPKFPVLEDNRVKLKLGEESTRDPVYTAMGAFITAYARHKTITAAQDNIKTFAYCDTDSLHLITTETPALDIDPDKLGAWKHEGDFTKAFYVRAKAYVERMVTKGSEPCEPHLDVHIAGLPMEIASRVTFDDLYDGKIFKREVLPDGSELKGKLQPVTVPGGIVLEQTSFTIKF